MKRVLFFILTLTIGTFLIASCVLLDFGASSSTTTTTIYGSTSTTVPADTSGSLIITEVGSCAYTNVSSWFEVYNNTTAYADLSTFQLRTTGRLSALPYTNQGLHTFSLPVLYIAPGSYAIIRGKMSDDFVNGSNVVYISDGSVIPNWVDNGSNTGSGIIELIKSNSTVDFVRFGTDSTAPTTSGWGAGSASSLPTGSGCYGYSIARDGSNTDTDSAGDWTSRDFATPGGPNDVTSNTDADLDGIPDCSEVSGSTFAGLDLYSMGARTSQKDIFLYIDYMNSSDLGVTPRKEAIDKVKSAFLAHSIYLHFDVGDLFDQANGIDEADYDLSDSNHKIAFSQGLTLGVETGKANLYEIKNWSMPIARRQIFHYVIFGYSQQADGSAGSSGLAEHPGNDLLITLGNWGLTTDTSGYTNQLINYQASTLMHEFGHNLGLGHGGDEDTNYKPNYFSIMNYMYQLQGLSTPGNEEGDRYYYYRRWRLSETIFDTYVSNGAGDLTNNCYSDTFIMDYSDGTGNDIDESAIVESLGIRQSTTDGVDYNGDSDKIDTISKDLNDDSSTTTLHDYNDWGNLNLFFQRGYSGDSSGAPDLSLPSFKQDVIGNDMQPVAKEEPQYWMMPRNMK